MHAKRLLSVLMALLLLLPLAASAIVWAEEGDGGQEPLTLDEPESTPQSGKTYRLTFKVSPSRAKATVRIYDRRDDGNYADAEAWVYQKKLKLPPGEYHYIVTAEGYVPAEGDFTMKKKAKTVKVRLQAAPPPITEAGAGELSVHARSGEPIPVTVGVIQYDLAEIGVDHWQVHWWNDSNGGEVDLAATLATVDRGVGSAYWNGEVQTFFVFTANLPAEATQFRVHHGDIWYGDGTLLEANKSAYVFAYGEDSDKYRAEYDAALMNSAPQTYRVFFDAPADWDDVSVQYWYRAQYPDASYREFSFTPFPGIAMTRESGTFYSADVPANVYGLIFNNGDHGKQTEDITSGIDNYTYWWTTDTPYDADGKTCYPVTTQCCHDKYYQPATEPTHMSDGNMAYWYCGICNKFFTDAEGTTVLEENSWIIPATGVALYYCNDTLAGTDDIARAFADADDNSTITLIADVTFGEILQLDDGRTLTLDLDGRTMDLGTQGGIRISGFSAGLTITGTDTGRIVGSGEQLVENWFGTLTIAGGVIESTSTSGGARAIYNANAMTVTGGKIQAASGAQAVYTEGPLTISGGTIIGTLFQAEDAATITISGGAFGEKPQASWLAEGYGANWDGSLWIVTDHVHVLTSHPATAASCTAAGSSAYWSCDGCGTYFGDTEGTVVIEANSWVIPALGHDWGDPTYVWTRTNDGWKCTATRACSRGDHPETEEVTATVVRDPAPTCTQPGTDTYTAAFANEAFIEQTRQETIPPAHTPEHHDAVAATIDDEGNIEYWTCLICGRYFSDAACTHEITEAQTVIQPLYAPTVTWVDGDGETLKTERVADGATPLYTGATPTRTATAQYTYTFNNTWVPAPGPIYEDTTYTAQFDAAVRRYTVTFVDGDGDPISAAQYDYGTPAANVTVPETAIRTADAQYAYTFTGWDRAVADVTEDASYTAQFSPIEAVAYRKDGEAKTASFLTYALADADEDSTICLQANLTLTETLTVNGGKTATLHIGDFSLTAGDFTAIAVESGGELHLDGTGTIFGGGDAAIRNGGSLTLSGPTVTGTGSEGRAVWNDQGDLTVTGGTIIGVFTNEGGQITVTGGSFCFDPSADNWVPAGYHVTQSDAVYAVAAHSLTCTAAVDATCTAAGRSAYWSCAVCGKYFGDDAGTVEISVNSWVIPALGHDWGEPAYAWAKTSGGWKCTATRACSRGDHPETEEVTARVVTDPEPTCTQPGTDTYTAAFTNVAFAEQTKQKSIPALGHSFENGVCTRCQTAARALLNDATYYPSVDDALTYAIGTATIALLADETMNGLYVTDGKAITLDLGASTLTLTDDSNSVFVDDGCSLLVTGDRGFLAAPQITVAEGGMFTVTGGIFPLCPITAENADRVRLCGGCYAEDPSDHLEAGYMVKILDDTATGSDAVAYGAGAIYKVVEACTVTFHLNGGVYTPANGQPYNGLIVIMVERGTAAAALTPDPALDQNYFAGWYLDNDTFQNEYDFSATVTSDVQLYARWKDNSVYCTRSLTLSDRIDINIYVKGVPDHPEDTWYAEYTFDGETRKVYLNEAICVEAGSYKVPMARCSAKEMTKEAVLQVYDGEGNPVLPQPIVQSVRAYCDDVLDGSYDADLKKLCQAVLEYGAYAQLFFNGTPVQSEDSANARHHHDAVEGANWSEEDRAALARFDTAAYRPDEPAQAPWLNRITYSLVLEYKTEMNFYIYTTTDEAITAQARIGSDAADWASVKVEEVTRGEYQDGKLWRIAVKGIPAARLGERIDLIVRCGESEVNTCYSPMTYAAKVSAHSTYGSQPIGFVCRALYRYYVAAKAFFQG